MCLILFAVHPNAQYHLIVAANRDEQYGRPSIAANYWDDHPHILGGRDLEAGGTWLGITRQGRFAAVTNFREDPPDPVPPRSRGELTSGFLTSFEKPEAYLMRIARDGLQYRGFNLIVGDGEQFCYYSNREGLVRTLTSGFYGLSNQLLDCNWPKVILGRNKLSALAQDNFPKDNMYQLLFDEGDQRAFSQSFVVSEKYGTTAATVLKMSASGEIQFEERNFRSMGEADDIQSFSFQLGS